MYNIKTEFHFSAAHRLEGHPKCGQMHGHNYVVEVIMQSPTTSPMGFVIDFSEAKKMINPIIDALDHKYIVSDHNVAEDCPFWLAVKGTELEPIHIAKIPIWQTSAENLANHLFWVIKGTMESQLVSEGSEHVTLKEVRVWETPKSWATYVA